MGPYVLEDQLRLAIDRNDLQEVTFLISKGADINAKDKHGLTPLHWAVNSNMPVMAELLISCGCELDARNETMDMTPLCLAAYNGSATMAALLLSHGARTDIADAGGDTPHDVALSMEHKGVAALLAAATRIAAGKPSMTQTVSEPALHTVSA